MFMLAFGCLLLGCGVAHEYIWRVRRKGRRTQGRIVAVKIVPDTEGPMYFPTVEFEWQGMKRTFTSTYGSSLPPEIGQRVEVMVPDGMGKPEVCSWWNRHVGTWLCLVLGPLILMEGLRQLGWW